MAKPAAMNFCPVCGQPLSDTYTYGKMRRMCQSCGFVHFQDPKVAVVVFIEHDDRVLMVKRGADPRRGKWALPAGYLDYGEDPRQAAIREVKEETGLVIRIVHLIDVLAPDPTVTPKSLVILFKGEVIGGKLVAGDDAQQAVFYSPNNLPISDLAFNHTHQLLTQWLEDRAG